MKEKINLKALAKGFAALLACILPASCVDNSWDFGQDIDLTIGVTADSMQIKLGDTEQILLKDMIEVDNTLKTDKNNTYYLVESGNTRMSFDVNPVRFTINRTILESRFKAVSMDQIAAIPGIPGVSSFNFNKNVSASDITATGEFTAHVTSIAKQIKAINNITPVDGTDLYIYAEIIQTGFDFGFGTINSLEVQMPKSLELSSGTSTVSNNTLVVKNFKGNGQKKVLIGTAKIKAANLQDYDIIDSRMDISEDVSMKADVEFQPANPNGFTVDLNNKDAKAEVRITIVVGATESEYTVITIDNVSGRFSPDIDLNVDDIDIAANLPDFLKDSSVVITLNNPTLKINANMTEIPVDLNIAATLEALDNGVKRENTARVPADGYAFLKKNARNILYISERPDAAYTPDDEDIPAEQILHSSGISELIRKIPDVIHLNMDDKISIPEDEVYTIKLGTTYRTEVDYDIYLPFEFNEGLRVVYKDSVENISDDLSEEEILTKDAKVGLKCKIINTVPLGLKLKITPVDKNGAVMPGVVIPPVDIEASTGENGVNRIIAIDLSGDPEALLHLDKLLLTIDAEAPASGKLKSTDYVQLKDMAIIVNGTIIYDANDK